MSTDGFVPKESVVATMGSKKDLCGTLLAFNALKKRWMVKWEDGTSKLYKQVNLRVCKKKSLGRRKKNEDENEVGEVCRLRKGTVEISTVLRAFVCSHTRLRGICDVAQTVYAAERLEAIDKIFHTSCFKW